MELFRISFEGRTARYIAVLLLFLSVAGTAMYFNAFRNKFVYDDTAFIVNNASIRSLAPMAKYFDPDSSSSDKMMNRDLWRPLTTFSYALTYRSFGLDPAAFHVIAVVIHIINSLLVFWLVLLLARSLEQVPSSIMIAFIASLTFLVHPVQTESVAWVSQRSNILFMFFYALAFISYIYYRSSTVIDRNLMIGASIFAFILSLFSKEMAISLPLVIFAYETILRQSDIKRSIMQSSPYFAIVIVFAVLRSFFLGKTAQTVYWSGGFIPQALTMIKGFALYVKLTLIPYPLSIEYLFPAKHSLDPAVLAYALVLAGLVYLGFSLRKHQPMISFGIFLFFLSLLPVSNLIPVRFIINERFLYLAIAGFGMILGQGAVNLIKMDGIAMRGIVIAVLILLFFIYAFITFERNLTWRDQDSFVTANIRTCPHSAQLIYGLGQAYASKGMFDKAADEFLLALRIDPLNTRTLQDLGLITPAMVDDPLIGEYRHSVQKRVDLFDGLHALGVAFFNKGDHKKAVKILEKACSLRPDDLEARTNLANAYAYSGKLEKAINLCVEILKIDPLMVRARYDLADFYGAAGLQEEARKQRELAGKIQAR